MALYALRARDEAFETRHYPIHNSGKAQCCAPDSETIDIFPLIHKKKIQAFFHPR